MLAADEAALPKLGECFVRYLGFHWRVDEVGGQRVATFEEMLTFTIVGLLHDLVVSKPHGAFASYPTIVFLLV